MAGYKLTIADFWIGGLYTNYMTNPDSFGRRQFLDLLQYYPDFEAYGKRYAEANKDYLAKRPQYPM